ncbi:MAG: DNA/RNA helicase domain-containing protein [Turicibacter sanguinis]
MVDDPNVMRDLIEKKNVINNKARIVAGYCWEWKKDGRNNTNHKDIEIKEHHFGMSWNLGNSSTWAIDPTSVKEAGCIHTCQGLEFDYVGVIIGDDMRYENGQVVTDFFKRASTDQSIKGLKGMYKKNPEEALELADKIIKNTYQPNDSWTKRMYICGPSQLKYLFEKTFKSN